MRSAWVALVLVGFAVCAAQRADAGAIYKFKALPRLHSGMLELTFEGTRVSGQVLPHPDNGNRAVPITGANPADGVVELTFHFDEPETAAFKRSINGNDIVWTSSTSGDSRFWRPRYGEFSEAALILEKRGDCGPIYRSLKVSFREGTTEQQVSTFFGRNRDLAQLPVTIWADRPPGADRSSRRHLPLGSALLTLLAREEVNRQVDVPVGTEVTVATMLGKSGFMGANLTEGGCGGSDASFFTFDRSLLFEGDRFLKDKFVRLIEQGLHAFAGKDRSGRTWDYAM
jgi:hypothetical protein